MTSYLTRIFLNSLRTNNGVIRSIPSLYSNQHNHMEVERSLIDAYSMYQNGSTKFSEPEIKPEKLYSKEKIDKCTFFI